MYKISGKSWSFKSNQTKTKKWKLQTRGFYWVCSWEIMQKCNISHAPSTGLSKTQFSILNVLEPLIPKDQKNITTLRLKSRRLLAVFTQHLTPIVVIIKILSQTQSLYCYYGMMYNAPMLWSSVLFVLFLL